MFSKKTLAVALCLAVTGCANTPQEGSQAGGHSWWPFGGHEQVEAAKPDPVPAKPEVQAKADEGTHWWWPFGGSDKAESKTVAAAPKIDKAATKAWLDQYEPKVRSAIKDSKFQVERREDVLVVTVPVDSSFNPDRPAMLLPVTLGPITSVAKLVEPDHKAGVLVLGHGDTSGKTADTLSISQQRAQSVAAIFRLSGLERDRLNLRGLGSIDPRAANDSAQGRSLNRRVEILLTPQETLVAVLARYNQPVAAQPAQMVALQDVKPVPEAKAAAKPAAKTAAKKPVAKKAAAKPAAKKTTAKAATPAKKTTVAKKAAADETAKAN